MMPQQLKVSQLEDASFLASSRGVAGCFNGMGSGKTLTALEAVNLVRDDQAEGIPTRTLIIAPPIALHMWQKVAKEWCGIEAEVLRTGKDRAYSGCVDQIYITTYAIAVKLHGDLEHWLGAPEACSICIADESHAAKTWGNKTTEMLYGDRGLALISNYGWPLTGTPKTRWNDDLYPFLQAADPSALRVYCGGVSLDRFQRRYCRMQYREYPGQPGIWTAVGDRNNEELGKLLAAVATRRTLQEVWKDDPGMTRSRLQVEAQLPAALRKQLAGLANHTAEDIVQDVLAEDSYLCTMLRQLGTLIAKPTADYVWELVTANQGPVLVGAWYHDTIDALLSELQDKGLKVSALTGKTPGKVKVQLQDEFNRGDLDVLIGQIASMGVSLNLQKLAHRIVVAEEDWSAAIMEQFYARLYRMGQTQPVHVDTLYLQTPLHEALHNINSRKAVSSKQLSSHHKANLEVETNEE